MIWHRTSNPGISIAGVKLDAGIEVSKIYLTVPGGLHRYHRALLTFSQSAPRIRPSIIGARTGPVREVFRVWERDGNAWGRLPCPARPNASATSPTSKCSAAPTATRPARSSSRPRPRGGRDQGRIGRATLRHRGPPRQRRSRLKLRLPARQKVLARPRYSHGPDTRPGRPAPAVTEAYWPAGAAAETTAAGSAHVALTVSARPYTPCPSAET